MRKMKEHGWWGLVTALLVLLWVTLVPLHARADYSIDNYHVQVNVLKDGNAEVTQTMRYDFDDDYHGVFNVQDLRGIRGAQLQAVTTQVNGGATRQATANGNGADNTYQVSQNKERMKVKLYQQVAEDDVLKVSYRYRLDGVVTNYADTAELNWKVIGNGWDVALHNVKIVIQLPSTNVQALQAWTHGPLAGHTSVDRKRGRITMTLQRNPANSFVESHLLFPTSVTATNSRTSDQKRKVTVQKAEAKLAKQANQKRQKSRLIRRLLVGAAAVIWLAIVLGYLWWFNRHPANRHQQPIPINHSFDVPPIAPAPAQSLWANASPDTNALTAEILQAAAAHEITITTEPGPSKKHPIIKLTQQQPLTNSFLAQCFKVVAKDNVLEMEALKKFGRHDKKGRLNKWFHQWQHGIDKQVAQYQDAENYAIINRWLGAAIAVSISGIVVSALGWLVSPKLTLIMGSVALVVAVAFWVTWLIRRRQILINTDEGLILANQINGLRRMLKDIGHFNTAEIGDLILWEQLLPYAAAFGLTKRVTDQLAVDFGTEALAAGFIYYPWFYGTGTGFDFSGLVNDSFSGALSASDTASSPSGGSGGFSGGSSGGFGGGSGGGAF